jgi:bifunctional non-homologous end joining protein LigD
MPNARFKSRTTFSATPRQPAKPRAVQPEASVGFASIPGAKAAAMPATLAPQLATLVKAPPAGAGWVHEIKYDGYRMLCRIEDGDARIISRNGKEWTEDFADIAHAAAKLSLH